MVISFVVNNLSETIFDLYPRRQAFYQPLHIGVPPQFLNICRLRPFYGRLHGVKFSYSLNSDLNSEYLIAEMLCIE